MKKRVLLVEAVICEQDWLTKSLSKAGYNYCTATCDGDWAFAYLRTHDVDVVVVGQCMGSRIKNERELVEAIRSIDPGQPMVILEEPYSTKRLLKWVATARREILPLFDGGNLG